MSLNIRACEFIGGPRDGATLAPVEGHSGELSQVAPGARLVLGVVGADRQTHVYVQDETMPWVFRYAGIDEGSEG